MLETTLVGALILYSSVSIYSSAREAYYSMLTQTKIHSSHRQIDGGNSAIWAETIQSKTFLSFT